jgi:hypothetical protein
MAMNCQGVRPSVAKLARPLIPHPHCNAAPEGRRSNAAIVSLVRPVLRMRGMGRLNQ